MFQGYFEFPSKKQGRRALSCLEECQFWCSTGQKRKCLAVTMSSLSQNGRMIKSSTASLLGLFVGGVIVWQSAQGYEEHSFGDIRRALDLEYTVKTSETQLCYELHSQSGNFWSINRSNIKAAHRAGFQHGERLFTTSMRNQRSLLRWFPSPDRFFRWSLRLADLPDERWFESWSMIFRISLPTHRFISRSCIKSWTRLIVSTKTPFWC